MIRRELKNFELLCGENKYSCHVPCSVHSVLSAAGKDVAITEDFVSFNTEIYVDDVALSMKNMYLRIKGVRMPSRVYYAGRLVGKTDGRTPIYNIDISGISEKGNNLLSIRFDRKEVSDITYAGLGMSIEILRFTNAIIDKVNLVQQHKENEVTLGIDLDLIGNSDSVRAVATLTSSSGQIYYAGLTKGRGSISVRDPLFWWPKGLGVQNLYRLTVTLYGDTDVEDTIELRTGLRKVLPPEKDSAIMMINGCKFLPMGAIYLGEEDPDFHTSENKMEAFVTSASMSNYNCLVIPADSPRPSGRFWDLCDIYGIVVIEEHMGLDDDSITAIERNCHHPSLCLIDAVDVEEIDRAKEVMKNRMPTVAISFVDCLQEYDSAPTLPSMKTLRTLIPENERTLFSKSIESLTNTEDMRRMLISVADRYPYPGNLSSFAYASALAAAHSIGRMVRASRMSMGAGGRAIFDRLGDPTLVVSGSAIDTKSRWKPLQYYSMRHFDSVKVYADMDGENIVFSASNLRKLDFIGSLEYRIADASNYTIYKSGEPCEISALSSMRISTRNISEYIKGHENEYYIEYYLKEGSVVLSKSTLLLVPEKHFAFKKPKLKAVISGEGKRFSITLSSNVFVKDLEIGFDGVDVVFEDNYIDLCSEAPVKINFSVLGAEQTSFHLKDALELFSIYDLL